jgi:hypothetical protein
MASRKRAKKLQPGDRVTDKLTGRHGTVERIVDEVAPAELQVAYDEAAQDAFLTTPAKYGAQRPESLLTPES